MRRCEVNNDRAAGKQHSMRWTASPAVVKEGVKVDFFTKELRMTKDNPDRNKRTQPLTGLERYVLLRHLLPVAGCRSTRLQGFLQR